MWVGPDRVRVCEAWGDEQPDVEISVLDDGHGFPPDMLDQIGEPYTTRRDRESQSGGGLGLEQHIDAELVIPDRDATLRKGAIAPWAKSSSPYYLQTLTALAQHYRFTLETKWKDLPKKVQDAILYGSGEDEIKFV